MARRRNQRSATELAELRNAGRRRSPLEALRARCLDCCAGSALEVEQCPARACASWPYRYGIDPWSSAELPAKCTAEPVEREPTPSAPAVEVTKLPTAARRTWRQHSAIYVDTAVTDATMHKSGGRGEDATSDNVKSAGREAAPAELTKVESVKRKRGRPRKQRSLFE